MAKYKHTDVEDGQGMFLAINMKKQLLPGTFEYMLNDLVGNTIDVSMFDKNYKNDNNGAPAIPPAALIKLIIYGYIKGIKSSRKLGEMAEYNIIAKALSGDMAPHWTTIADFISNNGERFKEVYVKVLAYCGELGLIGGEELAVDGRRISSNASMEMSGTKEELEKKLKMYRKMAEKHMAKHQKLDEQGETDEETKRHYQRRQEKLVRQIEKISGFLDEMEPKEGKRDGEIRSNVTDNESAMIHSSKGFLQGYIGIAAADRKNQIIIGAEAVGSANEGGHLPGILDGTLRNMEEAGVKTPEGKKLTVMADNDYFSEENFRACEDRGIEAIIPDSGYRKRLENPGGQYYEVDDFAYHEKENYYECPNGKRLEYKRTVELGGQEWNEYRIGGKDCRACALNSKCIKRKAGAGRLGRGKTLNVSDASGRLCAQMRKKLNLEEYQDRYAYRIQIVEPVFSSVTYCKNLDRFSLRGNKKVDGQWKLYCMVHNLQKCLRAYNKERGYTA